MGLRLTKLRRLVREADQRERDEARECARYMAMVCGAILANRPGLRLVQPCDADEATYARIQETIAKAECRTRDARRWHLVYEPVPPPKYTGTTQDEFREYFNAFVADVPDRHEREQLAVKAARKRLGMAEDDPESPYEPGEDPRPELLQ